MGEGLREFGEDWALLESARNSLMQQRFRAAAELPARQQQDAPLPFSESDSSAMVAVSPVRSAAR